MQIFREAYRIVCIIIAIIFMGLTFVTKDEQRRTQLIVLATFSLVASIV